MELALCRHVMARGHDACLLHSEPGDMVAAYEQAGATCYRVPASPLAVRHPFTAGRSVLSASAIIRRERLDLLFTAQINYLSLLAALGTWHRVRTVVHLGLVFNYPSPVFRAAIRRVDLAVAPSSHTADAWLLRGWPQTRLRMIPNGVDTTRFHAETPQTAARDRLGLPHAGPVVAFVGRVVRDKGVFTLVRAFARYRAAGGCGRLLLAGAVSDDDLEGLRRLAREEGLVDEAWEVRGPTKTPEDIYRAADLVVVPSEWDEPFGLVPLEAMACGTLTIVSDRGMLPEFVAPVGADAVFPSGDAEALSTRIASWLDQPCRRREAAARAAAHVRGCYSIDRCGDQYLSEFRTLLQ